MLSVSREKHREHVIKIRVYLIQDKEFKYFRENIGYTNWPIIFFLESINLFEDWRNRYLEGGKIALSVKVSFMMSERDPDIISTPNDTSFGDILSVPTDELLFNVLRISETLSLVALWN